MLQIGDFWLWTEARSGRVTLGNHAAAEAARATPSAPPPPDLTIGREAARPPEDLIRLGTYQIDGGPALSLDLTAQWDQRALAALLAPLISPHSPDAALQAGLLGPDAPPLETSSLTPLPQLRGLWRDGQLRQAAPPPTDTDTPFFNLVFELLMQLLERHPVLAILHGAAVLWRGRRIVLLGTSGSGKSTLAAQLVADGGAYIGDDYVVMLEDGRLVPVPLAPSLKEGSWPLVTPLFPQLADADVFFKEDIRLKYLSTPPFCRDPGPADLFVFPKFSTQGPAKHVALSEIEILLYLAQAGMWLQSDTLACFVDHIRRTPAIALRQTPDFDTTKTLLTTALDQACPSPPLGVL